MNKMKLTGVIGLVVFLILAACSGEREGQRGNRQFHGIEKPQADSVIRTAWLAKDYPHLLVIADSLLQTGDLSPQLADILRGDVYMNLCDWTKSKECFGRVIADHKPQAADIRLYQEADAERAYQAFCASNYAKTDNGILTRPGFLNLARRYAEAADCYAGVDRFIQQHGFDYTLDRIGNLLIPKLRANLQAGRKDTALYVAGQITEVYDSALTRYKRSAAAELATVYDVQGKERQIAQQQNDLLRQRLWAIAIVLALVVTFFFMYDVYRRRARKRLAAEQAARERIESELRIARNIQMSMVPGYFPDREGLDLYAEMSPAKEVGGDLYGYKS